MFRKPFRVKSNSLMKNSDKRKLRAELLRLYVKDAEEWVNSLISLKQDVYLIRLSLHSGDVITVYSCLGNPLFFHWNDNLIPTLYAIWQHPQLVSYFTTWPLVLEKLQNGADLMLPGVVLKSSDLNELGTFPKGRVTGINLVGNKAAVGVGVTAVSTTEIAMNGMRGKGVVVLHVYQDHLWEMGKKVLLPHIPDDTETTDTGLNLDAIQLDSDGSDTEQPPDTVELSEGVSTINEMEEGQDSGLHGTRNSEAEGTGEFALAAGSREDGELNSDTAVWDMDSLLVWCFLCALRSMVRKSDLPLLTSTLYSELMQQCCPAGANLDVKKTKYKKFSKFLSEMQAQGLVTVKEQSKGVDIIVAVEWKHKDLVSFVVPAQDEEPIAAAKPQFLEVEELWSPSASTLRILQSFGYTKASTMNSSDVRQAVTDYVKANGLINETNKSIVVLDPVLCHMLSSKGAPPLTQLKWDELMKKFFEKMSPCHRMMIPGRGTYQRKGAVKHVVISTAMRTGNKKVTLIRGLETFGVSPDEFAHHMQRKAAASTSVGDLPGKKGQLLDKEVLIQGDAVRLVSSLLIDKYEIPAKYVDGLDLKVRLSKKT